MMTAPSLSSFTYYCYDELKYDVFISFKVADTRYGFTGHLYRALTGKRIKSFMDNQDLELGSEINSALDQAIQHSLVALVVSKNYASSTFCLQELANIMLCSKNRGMLVLPVFYEVEPSDVRYQKGDYALALERHKFRRTIAKEKIQEWRLALTQVAALSGWHFKRDRFEYELIDTIVEHIIKRIPSLRDRDKYTTQCYRGFTFTELTTTTMEEKDYSQRKQQQVYKRDGGGGGIKGVRHPALAILDDTSTSDNIISNKTNLVSYYYDDGGKSENDFSKVDDSIHNVSSNVVWLKGELLGRGVFGTVYEGITEDGFFFAVKEVPLVEEGSPAKQSIFQLQQEIALLSQFEHENIVQYLGSKKDNNVLYIFLELVTKGSLACLYQKYVLRDTQVSVYTRQILSGLKYLHDRNVVHGDIKCANILVDASGSVKLADFGLAKVPFLNKTNFCKSSGSVKLEGFGLAKVSFLNKINFCKSSGSVKLGGFGLAKQATKLNWFTSKSSHYYMAPEVFNLRNSGYGLAADIWSLGCTVLEMLTQKRPYFHLEGVQVEFQIARGQPPPVPESLSKDARDFILKCFQVNPSKRPTSAQLLDHPFVKK